MRHFKGIGFVLWILFFTQFSWGEFFDKTLQIGYEGVGVDEVGFFAVNDAAGYSDWIWYGPTEAHDYPYHEILSGEWGAAIYYDGIHTDPVDPNDPSKGNQAMWLTRKFSFPKFYTNSDFVYGGTCVAFPDPVNPAPHADRGISVIRNDHVEITIDYEVVDLELIDSATDRSPMGYLEEATGYSRSMPSDRFCFLQTYTIKNIDPNGPLTGLEFYQLLHSHGNDEYKAAVNSTYTDTVWPDTLADYTPYNPVHQTGNFRYDVTQWNSMRWLGSSDHVDYISFSSVVEPDWIDSDTFRGGHSNDLIPEYDEGGYQHVKDRNLNDANSIYMDEVAGSMGWSLGALDPNETKSMTIAFMFGQETVSESAIQLTKTILDPNTCYSPGDRLTYFVEWKNLGSIDAENSKLIDYLPAGVLYPVSFTINPDFTVSISDPNYNDQTHTYELDLGTIPAYSGGSLELTVLVTEQAPPGDILRNIAEIYTSVGNSKVVHDANVCCWTSDGIIYVDSLAEGFNNGTSWGNAYVDLQDALTQARICTGAEIWVAEGFYDPGRQAEDTFALPDGTSVYGGFRGTEIYRTRRNPGRYTTILTGGADESVINDIVVTVGDECLLDGFTVTDSSDYGIYGNGVDFTVENCIITENKKYGIHALNGNVNVKWCNISRNKEDGIKHNGENFELNVENCWIMRNMRYGIFSENSTLSLFNSIISESDLSREGLDGIRMINPTASPKLYNNTIANNKSRGIFFADDGNVNGDPNYPDYPDIQNCIVYFNNKGGKQFAGFEADSTAYYSCIQDCNEVNFNINDQPEFAYTIDPNGTPDPNNYHLAYNSVCIDMGSPFLSYAGQVDIDGEGLDRQYGNYVDIGADEVYSCDEPLTEDDIFNVYDWNVDGVVNLYEFTAFSRAWLSHDPNDPAWIANPEIADPNLSRHWNSILNLAETGASAYTIDTADLDAFITDIPWLWTACWKSSELSQTAAMSGGVESMPVPASILKSVDTLSKETNSVYPISEMNSIEKTTVQMLAAIEKTIKDEPKHENIKGILEIKTFLQDCIVDIRSQK